MGNSQETDKDFSELQVKYAALLAAAKADPAAADFAKLREVYNSLPSQDAQDQLDLCEAQMELQELIEGDKWGAALLLMDKLLERDYLNPTLHSQAVLLYTGLHQNEKAAFHKSFSEGITKSVLFAHDSQNRPIAPVVTSVAEARRAPSAKGLRLSMQALVLGEDGKAYDLLQFESPDGGEPVRMYVELKR